MRAPLLLALACCSGGASAAGWTWDAVIPSGANTIEYTAGGITVSNGPGTGSMFIGRDFGAPSVGASRAQAALVNETLRLPSVGGAGALDVIATRGLSMLALGNAVVALGGAAYTGWQIGSAIANALDIGTARPGDARLVPAASGWLQDPGTPPSSSQGTKFSYTDVVGAEVQLGTDFSAACSLMATDKANKWATVQPKHPQMWTSKGTTGTSSCLMHVRQTDINYMPPFVEADRDETDPLKVVVSPVLSCPAVIDALNPAWSVPAGAGPDSDGKCRTGRYQGVDGSAVRDYIANKAPLTVAPPLAGDLLDRGQPILGADPGNITGPASKPLSPTTEHTVNPDGTTKDTTTTRNVNYTYGPQTINYSTTNVVTTNNAGNVTTTTTTTGPAPAPESEACKANPSSLGCSQFGTPPTDAPTIEQKPLQYSPDDLGFGGSCPAPWGGDIHFLGHTAHLAMSYQPVCDVAPVVRVGLLALAAMVGATLVVMGVSKT